MKLQHAENWIESHQQEIFAFLKAVVEINSFSKHDAGLIQTGETIVNWGREHGFCFQRIPHRKRPGVFHLYYESPSPSPYYALIGHIDTVQISRN